MYPLFLPKKAKSKNIDGEVYTSKSTPTPTVVTTTLRWQRSSSPPSDKVLILDDFLANGKAMKGLLDICKQSGCTVGGIGICIEKGFQPGGAELRAAGYKLASFGHRQ